MYAKTYDDGFTWTDPEILNPQIKRPTKETALLVSPGQGVLTSDGTIVIPFYDHGDGEENASIIWSDDNGKHGKDPMTYQEQPQVVTGHPKVKS